MKRSISDFEIWSIRAIYVIAVLFTLISFRNSVYIVDVGKQAIVIESGKVIGVNSSPGLHWKYPYLHKIQFLSNHVVHRWDSGSLQFKASNLKPLLLNVTVLWQVGDPKLFYEQFRNEKNVPPFLKESIIAFINDARSYFGKSEVAYSCITSEELCNIFLDEMRHKANKDINPILNQKGIKPHSFSVEVIESIGVKGS